MFKNANILYEIKNSKRRRYYAKFQDLALKRRREIFYEMDPWYLTLVPWDCECPWHPSTLGFVDFFFFVYFS